MDEFEKQVQTLESVHTLISKFSYFQLSCLYLEIGGRTMKNTYSCMFELLGLVEISSPANAPNIYLYTIGLLLVK